ncbi:hypothetical protein ACFVWN_20370 [Nocardiopsis flavescens]|uniref:hypothetical protein n=1 Tax=Nocardiopsis flavescens TaxID=758803 RepID=UPI003652BE54
MDQWYRDLIEEREKYGTPVGAYRYPGPDESRPDLSKRPTTVEDVNAWKDTTVRLTLTAGDYDIGPRVFDNVQVSAVDERPQMIIVRQCLIPSTEHGFLAQATEYAGLYFLHEVLSLEAATMQWPVRRTYKPRELHRFAGYGAQMTFVRARPDQPIEQGTVYRRVTIAMDSQDNTTITPTREPRPDGGTLPPLAPVPVEEVAFCMQFQPPGWIY